MKIGIVGLQSHQVHAHRNSKTPHDLQYYDMDKGLAADRIETFARHVDHVVVMIKQVPKVSYRRIDPAKLTYCSGSVGALDRCLLQIDPPSALKDQLKKVVLQKVDEPIAPKVLMHYPPDCVSKHYTWAEKRDTFPTNKGKLDFTLIELMEVGDIIRIRHQWVDQSQWTKEIKAVYAKAKVLGFVLCLTVYVEYTDIILEKKIEAEIATRPDLLTILPSNSRPADTYHWNANVKVSTTSGRTGNKFKYLRNTTPGQVVRIEREGGDDQAWIQIFHNLISTLKKEGRIYVAYVYSQYADVICVSNREPVFFESDVVQTSLITENISQKDTSSSSKSFIDVSSASNHSQPTLVISSEAQERTAVGKSDTVTKSPQHTSPEVREMWRTIVINELKESSTVEEAVRIADDAQAEYLKRFMD